MPKTLTKPRWRRRKDARPEEIISAALEVFADRGFAATKLEDVARRAGARADSALQSRSVCRAE